MERVSAAAAETDGLSEVQLVLFRISDAADLSLMGTTAVMRMPSITNQHVQTALWNLTCWSVSSGVTALTGSILIMEYSLNKL